MTKTAHDAKDAREAKLVSRLECLSRSANDTYEMDIASNYLVYIADQIDYERFCISVIPDLLKPFDFVFQWLQKAMASYPSVHTEWATIAADKKICEIVSMVANLSNRDAARLRRLEWLRRWSPLHALLAPSPDEALRRQTLTASRVFEAKAALARLASLVKHAAKLEIPDEDEELLQPVREHYDPNLVNRNKLLAIIDLVRVDMDGAADSRYKDEVLRRLDVIEAELKRPKVRWRRVIAGIFILFSFLSNIKTLEPGTYDKAAAKVQQLLEILHSEGGVESRRQLTEENGPTEPAKRPRETAMLPRPTRVRDDSNGDDADS